MMYLKYVIAGLCSGISYLIGDFDTALRVLLAFIIMDFISGVMVGCVTKTLSSEECFKGIMKKSSIILIVIAGTLLDRLLGCEYVTRTAVAYFFIANEGISLLENAGSLGLPIPEKVVDTLEKIKGDTESEA